MVGIMYLVAVKPPPNIRRAIYDYQVSLFRKNANPAALALPPHIPLAFFETSPPHPCNLVQQEPLKSCGCVEDPPWLLLLFQPAAELERLKSLLPKASSPPWYPTGRGALLSHYGAKSALPVDELPGVQWKTSQLVCLELKAESPGLWWESVEYREIWRVKLKRKID